MTNRKKNLIFSTSIGEAVRAWREFRGLTLTGLAQLSDSTINKGYISLLENNGIDQPNDEHLISLADALKIPVEYLVLRRLPGELSPDERTEVDEQQKLTRTKKGGFRFASPVQTPQPPQNEENNKGKGMPSFATPSTQPDADAQMRQILEKFAVLQEQVTELQSLIETFIAHRGKEL